MFDVSFWPRTTFGTKEHEPECSIGDALRRAAAEEPARAALYDGVQASDVTSWTYSELLDASTVLARCLLRRFDPGERIAIWAPNMPRWVLLRFGAALAGLVVVTVNPAYRMHEARHVLRHSGSVGVVYVRSYRGNQIGDAVEELSDELGIREAIDIDDWSLLVDGPASTAPLPTVTADDLAEIQYTSGTTGVAKGVMMRHGAIVENGRSFADRLGMHPGDVLVNPLPLFHVGGSVLATLGCLGTRATHVLVRGFDPALVANLIERHQASGLMCVPTMLFDLLEQQESSPRDLSSLRFVVCGGAPVPPEVVRRTEQLLGCRFAIVYGQTEMSAATLTSFDDTDVDKAETVGQPLPNIECKIVDPASGTLAAVNTPGEFCARGYNLMMGYLDDPQATAEALTDDGWLRTGDLASMDERGYFRIVGRLKDMIIRGGENIYPREIEECLLVNPSVAAVSVLGLDDPKWGQQVAVVFRPTDSECPPSVEELVTFCRERLAAFKTPCVWAITESFPLTASGKIQKFQLREWIETGAIEVLADLRATEGETA